MLSETIADLLKTTREERGFSIEDISRAISLRVEVIKNLEAGEFSKAGAMVYTKSYLRKYAQFLGIDRQSFEEMISQLQNDDPLYRDISETYKIKNDLRERQSHSYIGIYALIILLLLGGGAAFYYYDPLGLLMEKETIEADAPVETSNDYEALLNQVEQGYDPLQDDEDYLSADSISEGDSDHALSLTDSDHLSGIGPLQLLTEDDYRENALIAESQQAEELISQQREQERGEKGRADESTETVAFKDIPKDTLIIAVSGECWVGIKDRQGRQIANEILKDGTYDFNGTPPYSITVGNARAVESIIINGNEIDEKIYRPTPNTTVKNFSIDPKEYEQNE